MSRTTRPIFSNTIYFVTCTTHRRMKWFSKPEFAQIVVDQWKHYEQNYEFILHAYCVMPDHYHVILNTREKKTLSEILHGVNSYIVTEIHQCLGKERKTKVWNKRPWDEVVRNEEMYWQKVAYTLFNPWRAGLVEEPLEEYRFSNIGEWLDGEGEEFVIDMFSRYKRWYE